MLLYFTSGTTGMPKMVAHNFVYPLGHIVTAVYWHNADPEGLHLTVADTGWAKERMGESSMASGWQRRASLSMTWINLSRTSF